MKRYVILRLIAALVILSVMGCSAEKNESVTIYNMESFAKTNEDSAIIITDSEAINNFKNAFEHAKKQPGAVAMPNPEYKVELAKETYFLWIREQSGTIMNIKDTHTIYTLTKNSATQVNEVITSLEKHIKYLKSFGWHIKSLINQETKEVMDYLPEHLQGLKRAGLDLEPYRNKEVEITSYQLKERQATGKKMSVTLYEYNGEMIGGVGGLEDWNPGRFSLKDKERLIEDGIMNP